MNARNDQRGSTTADGLDVVQVDANAQLVLAADRTMLAMERTYAAWIRTGLAALASGVAARAFLVTSVPSAIANIMASLLVAFSGFCFVAGVWRDLAPFATAAPDLRRVPPTLLVGASAIMTLISLMALVGIWLTA